MSCELLYIKTLIRTVGCHFVHTYLAPYVRLPKPWTLKPMFSYLAPRMSPLLYIYIVECVIREHITCAFVNVADGELYSNKRSNI